MTYLSPNFNLEEFAVSGSHPELVKPVPAALDGNVQELVTTILQPLRDDWGKPMQVLSGYRSEALNKAVQGSPTSQHRLAEAADISTERIREFYVRVMNSKLPCGQVIYYPSRSFVHIALPSGKYPKPSFFVCRTPKVYEQIHSEREI